MHQIPKLCLYGSIFAYILYQENKVDQDHILNKKTATTNNPLVARPWFEVLVASVLGTYLTVDNVISRREK